MPQARRIIATSDESKRNEKGHRGACKFRELTETRASRRTETLMIPRAVSTNSTALRAFRTDCSILAFIDV